jgi:FkbM family methyltransferase
MNSIAHLIEEADPITILDIGASLIGDDQPPYQPLIDSRRARLIAFEPDPEALSALKGKYPPPHVCLPLFVGDGLPATFHETNWGPTGSLFEPNTPLLQRFHNLAELTTLVGTHTVQTKRLDDIPEITDVDFIKIDAQGAEKMIFENGPMLLGTTVLIQTEVTHVEMYKGMPLFGDIDCVLRQAGFKWHTRLGSGYRPFLPFLNPESPQLAFKQELWSDVVYVKDWMKFDQIKPSKLVKLALLLHDLYQSYDLAHVALSAADRQTGREYASDYAKWIIGNDDA